MEKRILKDLLGVVKGRVPPDTIIENGKIINVFTNSIDEGMIIVIKDGFITSVEEGSSFGSYMDARVIDAEGRYLCPGFIDAHTHLDSMLPYSEFVPYALRGGTTTVVTETSAAACACGMAGVEAFVHSATGYPVRCYFLVPPLTPPFPEMEGSQGLSLKEFKRLLKREDFVGVGEAYWTRIVDGDPRIMGQILAAMREGKPMDGHSAGARGKNLVNYMLTGITSCHESTTLDEVMEKLRFGMYIMIREGWVRRELAELSGIQALNVDMRRVMLVSDVFDSVMLFEEGYLDSIVRLAVGYGFSPMEAIKMVTVTPADYYGLRHLGALAPLRCADILFIDDLERVSVSAVMAGGQIVHYDGEFVAELTASPFPEEMKDTVRVGKITEDDLKVPAEGEVAMVRVVELAGQTITREAHLALPVKRGYLAGDPTRDIIPVAVINRLEASQAGKGFIRGTGIRRGALATTLVWDTGNILTLGSGYADMALAVNRLTEMKGGTVIASEGRIIYEFPMPVFGIMPLDTLENIKDKTKELETKMKEIGADLERPFLTVQTIPFTGLPFLRITDKGLADIRRKKLVSLLL